MSGVPFSVIESVRPARAGMSPGLVGDVVPADGPPRASGDEPQNAPSTSGDGRSAPRERG